MKMVSLAKLPDVAPKDPKPGEIEKPVYPYGTCLYLEEDVLAALGLDKMPSVGTEIPVTAIAKVTGTSEREFEGGTRKHLDLQITSMGFGTDAAEQVKKLYPSASDAKKG